MSAELVWSSVRGRAEHAALGPALEDFARAEQVSPSEAQARLLALDELRPGGSSRNLHFGYRLRGPLDGAALERALQSVWARHEGLRSHFPAPGVQRFHSPEGWRLHAAATTGEPESARAAAAELAATPFDARRERLFRAGLYSTGDDEHLLAICAHQTVFDAWSLDLLRRELTVAYAHSDAPLPALRASYSQYAAWQRARIAAPEVVTPLLDFWRSYLDGHPPIAGLGRPPADGVTGRRRRRARRLPPEALEPLRVLATSLRTSLFAGLFAAFSMLVAERTGEDDFVVLTPATVRPLAALHRLIGCFVDLHPVRADLRSAPSFAELVARCARGIAGVLEHQELPARMAAPHYGRMLSSSPLLFGLQNTPARPLELGGIEVVEEWLDAGEAEFGLYVNVIPDAGGGLTVLATYDDGRYDAGWIDDLLDDYARLVADCAAAPGSAFERSSAAGAGAGDRRLRQPPGADEIRSGAASIHRGDALGALCRQIAELTGAASAVVDVQRTPLELGLDSLKLIELASRIGAELQIDAPLQIYAKATSLRALAEDLLLLGSASRPRAPGPAVEVFTV